MKEKVRERPRVGVEVLLLNEKSQLLLGRRKNAHGAYSWSPPGGHLEFGETFEVCGQREVREEAGIVVRNLSFFAVTNDIFISEQLHYVSLFLRGKIGQEQTPLLKEPEKCQEWQFFSKEDLPHDLFLPLKNLLQQNAQNLERLYGELPPAAAHRETGCHTP